MIDNARTESGGQSALIIRARGKHRRIPIKITPVEPAVQKNQENLEPPPASQLTATWTAIKEVFADVPSLLCLGFIVYHVNKANEYGLDSYRAEWIIQGSLMLFLTLFYNHAETVLNFCKNRHSQD